RMANERFGSIDRTRRWLRRHDTRQLARHHRGEIMDELVQDTRYAVRTLLQQRAFPAAVTAVVGAGTGATTAIFSVVDAALVRPIAFDPGGRLVAFDNL